MTLITPATLPLPGPRDQIFELERIDYLAPEARGRIGGITAGFPLWKTTLTLGTMSRDMSYAIRAFVTGQRGAQRLFYGFEVARQMPRAYPYGLPSGFSGAATSWSQTIDSNGFAVLTLNGLPRGLTLLAGDYVDFRWGTYQRALVRLIEGGVANGSGVLSASVEPAVPALVPNSGTPAIAHIDHPACLMKLMPETQLGAAGRRGAIESGTIVAIQDLLP